MAAPAPGAGGCVVHYAALVTGRSGLDGQKCIQIPRWCTGSISVHLGHDSLVDGPCDSIALSLTVSELSLAKQSLAVLPMILSPRPIDMGYTSKETCE
jgi:hypothetical protein